LPTLRALTRYEGKTLAESQTQWYGQTFRENVYFLSQQQESRLINCIDRDDDVLEGGFFERLAATDMVALTSRFQPTPFVEMDHTRRYVTWDTFVWSTLIDKIDKLKTLADPESNYSRDARMGAGRKIDDQIIAAFSADAKSGKDGTTLVSFPAGQRILQAFETPLWFSLVKWLEIKRLLDAAEVPQEGRYLAARSRDLINLLQPTAISTTLTNPLLTIDQSTSKGLVSGEVVNYLGFTVVHSERLAAGSEASTFGVVGWQRDGMKFTMPQDFEFNLAQDPGFNYNWRPHLRIGCGAVRMEEVRVVIANAKNTVA
jgi:hypothetical protein